MQPSEAPSRIANGCALSIHESLRTHHSPLCLLFVPYRWRSIPLSGDQTANRISRSYVSFPTFVPMQDVNQWSVSRSKGTKPLSRPSSKSRTKLLQWSHIICFHLTHTDVAFAFLSSPIDMYIILLCPLFVRICPKPQTMPHIKGNPGATAGTVHHCPGRKISSYVKLGPCRGKKENGCCLTYQIPCLAPDCKEKH